MFFVFFGVLFLFFLLYLVVICFGVLVCVLWGGGLVFFFGLWSVFRLFVFVLALFWGFFLVGLFLVFVVGCFDSWMLSVLLEGCCGCGFLWCGIFGSSLGVR